MDNMMGLDNMSHFSSLSYMDNMAKQLGRTSSWKRRGGWLDAVVICGPGGLSPNGDPAMSPARYRGIT